MNKPLDVYSENKGKIDFMEYSSTQLKHPATNNSTQQLLDSTLQTNHTMGKKLIAMRERLCRLEKGLQAIVDYHAAYPYDTNKLCDEIVDIAKEALEAK